MKRQLFSNQDLFANLYGDRIYAFSSKEIDFERWEGVVQAPGWLPDGLRVSCGSQLVSQMPKLRTQCRFIYDIAVNLKRLLIIKSAKKAIQVSEKFGDQQGRVDWRAVAEQFDGVLVVGFDDGVQTSWYRQFCIDSGVIWSKKCILSTKLVFDLKDHVRHLDWAGFRQEMSSAKFRAAIDRCLTTPNYLQDFATKQSVYQQKNMRFSFGRAQLKSPLDLQFFVIVNKSLPVGIAEVWCGENAAVIADIQVNPDFKNRRYCTYLVSRLLQNLFGVVFATYPLSNPFQGKCLELNGFNEFGRDHTYVTMRIQK